VISALLQHYRPFSHIVFAERERQHRHNIAAHAGQTRLPQKKRHGSQHGFEIL
jgi:hypothetical protein